MVKKFKKSSLAVLLSLNICQSQSSESLDVLSKQICTVCHKCNSTVFDTFVLAQCAVLLLQYTKKLSDHLVLYSAMMLVEF